MAGDELLSPNRMFDLGPTERTVDPNDPNKDEVVRLTRLLDVARNNRMKFDRNWERFYRLWATDAWSGIPMEKWRSRPQTNYIYSTIETVVAIMTDQNPQVVVFPRNSDEEDMEIAEIMGKIMMDSWEKGSGSLSLQNTVRDSMIYGTGYMKIVWSDDRDNIDFIPVPVDQLYVDPSAVRVEDAFYLFHVYQKSFNWVIQHFPDVVDKIQPGTFRKFAGQFERDVWAAPTEHNTTRGGTASITTEDSTISNLHTTRSKADSGEPMVGAAEGEVSVVEAWEKNPKTGKIRLSFIINGYHAGSRVNPIGDKVDRFPFVRFLDVPVNGEFYGIGEAHSLEPIQLSANKRRQQIIDYMRQATSASYIADGTTGLEEDIVTGSPGEVIMVDNIQGIKPMEVAKIPNGLFQLQQFDKQEIEQVSGIHDIVQGRRPKGIEAAAALETLQESAQTKIRMRTRLMEGSIEQIGLLMLKLIQSHYVEERVVNLVSKGGQFEAIEINKAEISDVDELPPQEELGAAQPEEENTDLVFIRRSLDITRGDFDVQIKAGSTLPITLTARLNEALLLFDRGIVDATEVLTTLNHPRKLENLRRRAEREKVVAAQAAQQQQLEQQQQSQ